MKLHREMFVTGHTCQPRSTDHEQQPVVVTTAAHPRFFSPRTCKRSGRSPPARLLCSVAARRVAHLPGDAAGGVELASTLVFYRGRRERSTCGLVPLRDDHTGSCEVHIRTTGNNNCRKCLGLKYRYPRVGHVTSRFGIVFVVGKEWLQ